MRSTIGILCVLLGSLALAASFVTPSFVDGRSAWTEEQAARYSKACQQLHVLAFSAPTEENRQRLQQVQAEQRTLSSQLEHARQQSGRAAWWLRGVAVLLISIALFSQRAKPQP